MSGVRALLACEDLVCLAEPRQEAEHRTHLAGRQPLERVRDRLAVVGEYAVRGLVRSRCQTQANHTAIKIIAGAREHPRLNEFVGQTRASAARHTERGGEITNRGALVLEEVDERMNVVRRVPAGLLPIRRSLHRGPHGDDVAPQEAVCLPGRTLAGRNS